MTNDTWSRRDLFKRGTMIGGILLAPSLAAACQRTEPGTGQAQGGTLARLRDQGYVDVGFANEAPYAFRKGGDLVGEAPSVHKAIFKALGVDEVRPNVTDFDGLIPGLNANRWDVVTAGMFILPERCRQAAFSNPEYCGTQSFLVKEGNPMGITSFDDVAKKEIKLGVLPAAVEADYAEDAGLPKGNISSYDSAQDGLEALVAGRIDAYALTSPSLNYLADVNPGAPVEVTEPFYPVIDGEEVIDCGGAVFRKQDDDLRKAFNEELAKLQESGRLLELIKPWGFTKKNIPPEGTTAAQLCKE